MLNFTELVATAIANAESRSELAASRARIVTASDEARRRVERDLHDGVQQRLVSLTLDVRAAQSALPPALTEVRAELSRVCEGLTATLDELREVARGIHPEVLSRRGLGPALKTLARRAPIQVVLDFRVGEELSGGVEVAAYYAVSEMLTNTVKHAQASAISVDVTCLDGILHVAVRDDGIGGADPARGSGLVGLRDRIEALGGTIFLRSPKGEGTAGEITLPIADDRQAGDNLHGASLAGGRPGVAVLPISDRTVWRPGRGRDEVQEQVRLRLLRRAMLRSATSFDQQASQQPSPRQLSRPSSRATAAMTSAVSGSAHHQPASAFAPRPSRSERDYLAPHAIERLLGQLPDTFRPNALVCALAGARISEVLGLRWRDIAQASLATDVALLGMKVRAFRRRLRGWLWGSVGSWSWSGLWMSRRRCAGSRRSSRRVRRRRTSRPRCRPRLEGSSARRARSLCVGTVTRSV